MLRKANGVWKNLFGLLAFPFYVLRAMRRMRSHALTYINTSVVFDYIVASRLTVGPVILHIHEIPTDLAMRAIRAIVGMSKADLLYNSAATKRAFGISDGRRQTVLHNGIPHRSAGQARSPFSDSRGRIRLLMVGRINSWKGQDLLVQAVAALPSAARHKVDIKFAGAAFEDGPEVKQLATLIRKAELERQVQLEGFVRNPSDLYQWADIVVVPSKKPEPFGLVAVEAMAHGRPVIAANHGGLMEIVLHEETGLLFEPGNPAALTEILRRVFDDPAKMRTFGSRGQSLCAESFTEARYKESFLRIVGGALASAGIDDASTRVDDAGIGVRI